MWPLVYLSLLNIGLGFSAALVVYLRVRYVQAQLARGYDLKRLSPPSKLRNLMRRLGFHVQVARVCERLGEPAPNVSLLESSLTTLEGLETPTSEVREDVGGADETEMAGLDTVSSENSPPKDTFTLEPVSRPDGEIQELAPTKEPTPREVRFLEPLLAKYGGENGPDLSKQRPSAKEVATLGPNSPRQPAKLSELNSDHKVKATDAAADRAGREKFTAAQAGEGDFLQRAASIDRMLRAVMDEEDSDPEATLRDVITEVQGTHQWWTEFEGSVTKALSSGATSHVHREQRAQVDDDLIAMQASLVECKNLIESIANTNSSQQKVANGVELASSEFPRDIHNHLTQATKACHRLRDNLTLLTPESPLRFSAAAPPDAAERLPLAYVPELGVQGVAAVVSQWDNEVARGVSKVASLVLVDVDRTAHWNNVLGLRSVDRILDICHRQLAESVRSNRGFDRVVRICGQQFLIFLGATHPTQAKFAADRLRQIFANTTWRESGQALVIQLSAAVSPFDASQSIGAQIANLRTGLPEAKRLGGNTVVEQGQSGRFQKITGVPKYQLPARHHDQPLEKWNPKASVTC